MPKDARELLGEAARLLEARWTQVAEAAAQGALADSVADEPLRSAIHQSINSETLSYRYVLPTQLLAKTVDASLDCRSLQVAAGRPGAFDARSLCHKVIVPFDRRHESVLGGSPEPYVNNPLRIPEITQRYAAQQKNKAGWNDLCAVLDAVESRADPSYTADVFTQVLIEIHRRLATVRVTYPVPMRISLEQCTALILNFLAEESGGDRPQAVASALFLTIGQIFKLYTTVRRGDINAADAASGQIADLECVTEDGEIVLAVEVKDKALTLRQIQDKLPSARARKVTEIIFLALRGVASAERQSIADLIVKEYSSGHNIYIVDDMSTFLRPVLALLGEAGRRRFLEAVGGDLDQYRADIAHRRAWAELLRRI